MHLIIARALASRARNARLFPSKFLVALPFISKIWLGVAGMLIAFRMLAASGPLSLWHCAQLILALALPVFVLQAVLDRYPAHSLSNQPSLRLARLGRWRQIPALECSAFEKYGSGGLLTMLIAGLLLNIPVRVFEFMAAMPAPKLHTPSWYLSLHDIMLADLVIFSTCYAALVGLAIRNVPLFPRLLAAVWLLDLAAQLAIGGLMAHVPNLPTRVEHGLGALLTGNMQKVAISMAIWVPYLIMSRRVNLTYRHRIPVMARQRSAHR
ncbi:MAG: DUF2569 domain-containing protein [Sphingomonadaceae bacterium]